jgi:putative addiction module antidote
MMLKLVLRKTGNSIGLVLPKEALDHLGAAEGDTVLLTFLTQGALRLSTEDPEFERAVETMEKVNRVWGRGVRSLTRRIISREPTKDTPDPAKPPAKG